MPDAAVDPPRPVLEGSAALGDDHAARVAYLAFEVQRSAAMGGLGLAMQRTSAQVDE